MVARRNATTMQHYLIMKVQVNWTQDQMKQLTYRLRQKSFRYTNESTQQTTRAGLIKDSFSITVATRAELDRNGKKQHPMET